MIASISRNHLYLVQKLTKNIPILPIDRNFCMQKITAPLVLGTIQTTFLKLKNKNMKCTKTKKALLMRGLI